jgi:hypothetical protein
MFNRLKTTVSVSLFTIVFATLFTSPFSVFAQTPTLEQCAQKWQIGCPIVPCGTITDANGKITNPCGFNDAVTLVSNIISFLIYAGMVLSGIAFIYVGWLYLSAGGDSGKVKQAKDILWKVIWGFVIMCSAWLLVKTIAGIFVEDAGILKIYQQYFGK